MKSFSGATKEELCAVSDDSCCCAAEYMGMLLFGAGIGTDLIKFATGSVDVAERFLNLCKMLEFTADNTIIGGGAAKYIAEINDKNKCENICDMFNLFESGIIKYRIYNGLLKKECCRRAFFRGAFLGGGTVIDPGKNYNLEFITPYLGLSRDLLGLLAECGFDFKPVMRKSKYVLYIKNSEMISDFLAYMEAYKAQMALLNVKIEKEIHNDFNRSINIETANLEKTIEASVRQVRAIEKLKSSGELEKLDDDLRELALLRLANKELSLSELGAMMKPPMSKSGVNRRMKRLIETAE